MHFKYLLIGLGEKFLCLHTVDDGGKPSVCKHATIDRRDYRAHLDTHVLEGFTRFDCTFCGLKFLSHKNFIVHLKQHGPPMNVCGVGSCPFKNHCNGAMRRHRVSVHKEAGELANERESKAFKETRKHVV